MCVLKNEFSEGLLKQFRSYDKKEEQSVNEKAEMLAKIKIFQDELEKYEAQIKKDLAESINGEIVYLPALEKKVYLTEERASTVFDNAKVFEVVGKEVYLNVSSVQKGKLEEALGDDAKKVIANCSETKEGNPSITCSKMNKKELIEHRA